MTSLDGCKLPNAVEQLLWQTIKILSDFGRSHRVVQRFTHQRQHIVKIIR
jgi:hypothetical protein